MGAAPSSDHWEHKEAVPAPPSGICLDHVLLCGHGESRSVCVRPGPWPALQTREGPVPRTRDQGPGHICVRSAHWVHFPTPEGSSHPEGPNRSACQTLFR